MNADITLAYNALKTILDPNAAPADRTAAEAYLAPLVSDPKVGDTVAILTASHYWHGVIAGITDDFYALLGASCIYETGDMANFGTAKWQGAERIGTPCASHRVHKQGIMGISVLATGWPK